MTDRDPTPANWLDGTRSALRPPPKLTLSEWADQNFVLSAGDANPGRWHTYPYQREIMDAITDPEVERITWLKSSRVGATKVLNATVGYYMQHDPCPIMGVQPTVVDAELYSKEEIAPMLRDVPVLRELMGEPTVKTTGETILHKSFPGGLLSMIGANSARGFRRVSRRVVLFDEIDGYPSSAGSEGDPIKLGIRRTSSYWNRKIVCVSTPLVEGTSRIAEMFLDGDQRRYYVPCPHCGHMDVLAFREPKTGTAHVMQWPKDEPEEAYFACSAGGCVITNEHKRAMMESGEWRAAAPFTDHASFAIWAAYSLSPHEEWGDIATEFVKSKDNHAALKAFVNTILGETWVERGEAPDWERLYSRRESYTIGTVPAGVSFLTAGVDVQRDRFVYEVVGWCLDKQSYSIDAGVLLGEPDAHGNHMLTTTTWAKLDALLARTYPGADREWPIAMLAIDSGHDTQAVYNWGRRKPMSRVIAVKGSGTERTLVGMPSPVDVTVRGRRHQRGYKVWPVGVNVAKSELYGWLRLPIVPDGEPHPPGYCHFPEHPVEYFKQLTAEHLVPVAKRTGHVKREWRVLPGRENHGLDCRVYARAAASVQGLDRHIPRDDNAPPPPKPTPRAATDDLGPREQDRAPRKKRPKKENWVTSGRGAADWLRGRRMHVKR